MITETDVIVGSREGGNGIPATPVSTTCDQRTRFHVHVDFIGAEFVVTCEQILFSERMTALRGGRMVWIHLWVRAFPKTCTSLCNPP